MAANEIIDSKEELSNLRSQLTVARNEIHNLRQQIKSLGYHQQKEVDRIQHALDAWQCENCHHSSSKAESLSEEGVSLRPIGVVSTWFPEKRGTPRQAGVCVSSHGKLTLFSSVFTNPEHALEGLEEFSHMWILFHFHKNETTHVRAKVSPPRLNGVRTGVFGTRSPHRPSPIGLSLVSIDRVVESTVYFSGVDMLDGTPVLDIKPYIPQYDNPLHCDSSDVVGSSLPPLRCMDGQEAEQDSSLGTQQNPVYPLAPNANAGGLCGKSESRFGEREAPDGEEGNHPPVGATAQQSPELRPTLSSKVRVPAWIAQPPVSKLLVTFSDRAKAQLESLADNSDAMEGQLNAIRSVLREDPRSVYLRERWGNQFYTFLICSLHVSCKFDDSQHTVTVFQVKSAGKMCDCGHPEWQCSVHGESYD
ncbi:tRNA (adenine(37)-N6)-methyltransferase [Anabrus simplex]|uniref:tRNA (adenine(37)-N6)-methyltransferase n=1 Tax=Anabrus simplex TaxID=316456 RepID=UPI0034DD4D1A